MDLKFNLNQKMRVSDNPLEKHRQIVEEMKNKLGPQSEASMYLRHIAYLLQNAKPVANQLVKLVDKKLPEATITIDSEEFDLLPYVTSKIDSPGCITYGSRKDIQECDRIEDLAKPVPLTGISLARSTTIPIRDLLINIDVNKNTQLVVAFRVITDLKFLEEAWEAYSTKLSMKITEDESTILSSPGGAELLDTIIHGTHDDGERKILGIMVMYNYNGSRDILLIGSSEVGYADDDEDTSSKARGMTSQTQYGTSGLEVLSEKARENFEKSKFTKIPSGRYGLVALPVYSNMKLGYGFFRHVKEMETLYDKKYWFTSFLNTMVRADVRSNIMLSIWNAVELILLHPTISSKVVETKEAFSGYISSDNVQRKSKKAPLKYIKKLSLDIGGILNERDEDGNRKFFRKADYWYVIGHYRHYKSGKTVWIDGYWKGELRAFKNEISAPTREREL